LAEGAIDRLLTYNWPGNVREVANVVERALIQSDGKQITFEDLPATPQRDASPDSRPASAVPFLQAAAEAVPHNGNDMRLEEVEARHIRRVMEMTVGKIEGKQGAAAVLGMNPATLRYRMQKLGIPFGRLQKKESTSR
ncbi:MAG: helix-turn-helix domain-containing protein, partial [Syntrophorhabdales bacterium]